MTTPFVAHVPYVTALQMLAGVYLLGVAATTSLRSNLQSEPLPLPMRLNEHPTNGTQTVRSQSIPKQSATLVFPAGSELIDKQMCVDGYKYSNPFTAYLNALRCGDITRAPTILVEDPISKNVGETGNNLCPVTIYWQHTAYGNRTFCARGNYYNKFKTGEELRRQALHDLASPEAVWQQNIFYIPNPVTATDLKTGSTVLQGKGLIVYSVLTEEDDRRERIDRN